MEFIFDLTMESKFIDWSHLLLVALLMSLHRCSRAQVGTSSTPLYDLSIRDNFKASFTVPVVGSLCGFALFGFVSLFLLRCANMHVHTRNSNVVNSRVRREVINKCPILLYSAVKDLRIGQSALECAVCLAEFQDNDNVRLLPKCHHLFHPDCIDAWFKSRLTCPVCRVALTLSDFSDNEVASPTASNPDESHPAASGEIEPLSTAESREPPEQRIRVDESGSTGPLTQTTPPIQSRTTDRFPRSHSTGHSLFMEPEEMMESRIRRSASSDVVMSGVWSSKRGSDNMERWALSYMTPPFVSRDLGAVNSVKNNTESSSYRPPV